MADFKEFAPITMDNRLYKAVHLAALENEMQSAEFVRAVLLTNPLVIEAARKLGIDINEIEEPKHGGYRGQTTPTEESEHAINTRPNTTPGDRVRTAVRDNGLRYESVQE